MSAHQDKYASFVEHPRYGQRPDFTGLDLQPNPGKVTFHWHSSKSCRIPGTAITADLARQTAATVAVTHYFDVERICQDCGRPFIFFAQEQKHWYEELGFGLDSNCVRCVPCRKRQQGIGRHRERYEELFHVPARTVAENLEFADCCLTLIEQGVFHKRQTERVRMLLNLVRDDCHDDVKYKELATRLKAIENQTGQHGDVPNV